MFRCRNTMKKIKNFDQQICLLTQFDKSMPLWSVCLLTLSILCVCVVSYLIDAVLLCSALHCTCVSLFFFINFVAQRHLENELHVLVIFDPFGTHEHGQWYSSDCSTNFVIYWRAYASVRQHSANACIFFTATYTTSCEERTRKKNVYHWRLRLEISFQGSTLFVNGLHTYTKWIMRAKFIANVRYFWRFFYNFLWRCRK